MELKQGIVCLLLGVFLSAAAQGQTQSKVFSNINNSLSGWGSCTSCAGGENDAGAYWMAQFQSSPARDGSSTEFYVSATEPYSNVLFWNKLGPENWATHLTWDFWVYLDSASLGAQNLEYDMFQFVGGVEYMFGTQCSYAAGYWDVWNQATGHWVQTSLPCQHFTPGVWHHIVWRVHRTTNQQMQFDSLTLDGKTHTLNLVEPSGPLPAGWAETVGVQWQLDTASQPTAFSEWIDNVKLTLH
jgi:hypothetical protein